MKAVKLTKKIETKSAAEELGIPSRQLKEQEKEIKRLKELKTKNGGIKGKIAFCCKALEVSRQGFYEYLKHKNNPWKYEEPAAMMTEIHEEDECNDTYGRVRMREALLLKKEREGLKTEIPNERTIYRIMQKIGLSHRMRNPKGLTKADLECPIISLKVLISKPNFTHFVANICYRA